MPDQPEPRLAVFCEATGHDRPLMMHDRSFAQIIDEVIVPYELGDPFFVDGAPITREKIRRLKILLQKESFFDQLFGDLHWGMRAHSDVKLKQVLADQYHIRFEALLREGTTDVTAQLIRAFNTEVKPKLRDYLPQRKELIEAALRVFTESLKLLGSGVV